jgi:hypothetical protein
VSEFEDALGAFPTHRVITYEVDITKREDMMKRRGRRGEEGEGEGGEGEGGEGVRRGREGGEGGEERRRGEGEGRRRGRGREKKYCRKQPKSIW